MQIYVHVQVHKVNSGSQDFFYLSKNTELHKYQKWRIKKYIYATEHLNCMS